MVGFRFDFIFVWLRRIQRNAEFVQIFHFLHYFFAFSIAVTTSKPPVVDFPFTKINQALTKVEAESWNFHTFVHSFIYSNKVEYLLTKICQFYTKKRYPLTLGGGRKGRKVLLKRIVVVLRFIFVTKIRWGINIILIKAK